MKADCACVLQSACCDEVDRLRAELADLQDVHEQLQDVDARLAAVLALCDFWRGWSGSDMEAEVRAAATGGDQ